MSSNVDKVHPSDGATLQEVTRKRLGATELPEHDAPSAFYVEFSSTSRTTSPQPSGQTLELPNCLSDEFDSLVQKISGPPRNDTVKWLHFDGINSQVMTKLFSLLNISDPGKTLKLVKERIRQPTLQWCGTHAYICMHKLKRNQCQDFDLQLSETQVSFVHVKSLRLIISVDEGQDDGDEEAWNELKERLVTGTSTANSDDDPAILLALLCDTAIDATFPLVEQLGDLIEILEGAVGASPKIEYSAAADRVKEQLWLSRRFAWRLRRLSEQLIEDSMDIFPSNKFKKTMQLVINQTISMNEVATAYIERCGGVTMAIEGYNTKKSNDTLFILTILTALMIPTQFLTGVWGMNFKNMPELNTSYGYWVFWALVPTLWIVTYVIMKMKGLIGNELGIEQNFTKLIPEEQLKSVLTTGVSTMKNTHKMFTSDGGNDVPAHAPPKRVGAVGKPMTMEEL